jgi:hypothetical protein
VGRGQLTGDPSFVLGTVGFERRKTPVPAGSLERFSTPERMFALSQEIVPVPLGAAPRLRLFTRSHQNGEVKFTLKGRGFDICQVEKWARQTTKGGPAGITNRKRLRALLENFPAR